MDCLARRELGVFLQHSRLFGQERGKALPGEVVRIATHALRNVHKLLLQPARKENRSYKYRLARSLMYRQGTPASA